MIGNVMKTIKVYHKPTCTTSRKVIRLLSDKRIVFEKINYYEERFTKSGLSELLEMMNKKPSDLLRKKEATYKKLDFKNKKFTESQILNLIIENPDLIERPIVQKGKKAILARPPETVESFV
jgi:arsenate reductase